MPKKRAVTIGLNAVDPAKYAGWPGKLNGAEIDQIAMEQIARDLKFDPNEPFRGPKAKCKPVLDAIHEAALDLDAGDFFFLTFSGHGRHRRNDARRDPDDPEPDDQTWCLFDGELVDDRINLALSEFRPGVRVFVVSDSCHSGSVVTLLVLDGDAEGCAAAQVPTRHRARQEAPRRQDSTPGTKQIAKHIPEDVQEWIDAARRRRGGARRFLADGRPPVQASVLLLAACEDRDDAMDLPTGGVFTSALVDVWNKGAFDGDYMRFRDEITDKIETGTSGSRQRPQLLPIGKSPFLDKPVLRV